MIRPFDRVMSAAGRRLNYMSISLPAFLGSPRAAVDSESGQVLQWHTRGQLRYTAGLLLMLAASIVTSTAWPEPTAVLLCGGVLAAVARFALVRSRIGDRRWTLLLWPVATCATLSVLHIVSDEAGLLLSGLIVLAFQFVGISQPPGRGLWLMIPAAALFIQLTELTAREAVVRLPIAMLVWLVVSEVPSRLIDELRVKQRELEELATTDSLTGLLNRSRLEEHLSDAGKLSAVAVIDLDHFKDFNDANGHIAGDIVLRDFAAILRANTRATDRVFRYGGEEFLVIFSGTTVAEAAWILGRCADEWSERNPAFTFSAGIAEGGAEAVKQADELLYIAKRDGRARVLTADSSVS